jgi:hypothetical protein
VNGKGRMGRKEIVGCCGGGEENSIILKVGGLSVVMGKEGKGGEILFC